MLTTDYSKVALRYDKNKLRHDIPVDENIGRLRAMRVPSSVASHSHCLRVLDLACGTGNYLKRQIEAYPDRLIEWIGVDKTPAMLAEARRKELAAKLIEGDATAIPLEDACIDYVKIRFAFHHFLDKEAAVAEVERILRPDGELSIFNLAHDYMKDYWAYRYFPSMAGIDDQRFPGSGAIFEMLEKHGFSLRAKIERAWPGCGRTRRRESILSGISPFWTTWRGKAPRRG